MAKPRTFQQQILPKLANQPIPLINDRAPRHLIDLESILAVNTALACRRPLLVRGEPGTGKSQLARAVAVVLERELRSRVVDARTEAHELMWEYDALGRLAAVQTYKRGDPGGKPSRMDYTRPGPLWWAFNWVDAARQAKQDKPGPPPEQGVVVLIDEIDKADMAVPNALLECLGDGWFRVPGREDVVKVDGPAPLVVLTTNTDRTLPDAFVRRCVVLHMRVPEHELVEWLMERAKVHFKKLDPTLLRSGAQLVAAARAKTKSNVHCPPGLAEYIDLLTAVRHEAPAEGVKLLERLSRFVLSKHVDPGPFVDD